MLAQQSYLFVKNNYYIKNSPFERELIDFLYILLKVSLKTWRNIWFVKFYLTD